MMRFLLFLAVVATPAQGDVKAMVETLQGVNNIMIKALSDNQEKCAKEAVEFESAIRNTQFDVERYKDKVASLGASIVRDDADSDALATQIEKDTVTLDSKTAELKRADSERAAEIVAFNQGQSELKQIITTIRSAVSALSGSGTALLQAKPQEAIMKTIPAIRSVVEALSLSTANQKTLDSFVQSAEEGGDDFGTYVSRGADVLSLLHSLEDDAENAFSAEKTTEQNAQFNFNKLTQEIQMEQATLQKAIQNNRQLQAGKRSNSSTNKGGLAVADTNKADAINLLNKMKSDSDIAERNCKDFEEETQDTIASMDEAIKVLSSDAIGNAIGFLQETQILNHVLYVQLGTESKSKARDDAETEDQQRAARFLSDMAERLGSPVLAQVGEKVAAGNFDFVIRMIEDMLLKLNNISNVQDFCAAQVSLDEAAVKAKNARADRTKTQYEKAVAVFAQYKAELSDTVDSIGDHQQDLTLFKTDFAKNKRDAAANLRALETVAHGFNAAVLALEKASAANSVVNQVRDKEAQVSKEIVRWQAIEDTDGKTFKRQVNDMEANIAGLQKSEKLLRMQIVDSRAELSNAEAELHDVQIQLGAVEGTLSSQQKDCDQSATNLENRQARTAKEKLALSEALSILKADGDA